MKLYRGPFAILLTTGYGETQPVTSNSTTSGRAQNGRSTVELTPITR